MEEVVELIAGPSTQPQQTHNAFVLVRACGRQYCCVIDLAGRLGDGDHGVRHPIRYDE